MVLRLLVALVLFTGCATNPQLVGTWIYDEMQHVEDIPFYSGPEELGLWGGELQGTQLIFTETSVKTIRPWGSTFTQNYALVTNATGRCMLRLSENGIFKGSPNVEIVGDKLQVDQRLRGTIRFIKQK
jgi:hypothetical protein